MGYRALDSTASRIRATDKRFRSIGKPRFCRVLEKTKVKHFITVFAKPFKHANRDTFFRMALNIKDIKNFRETTIPTILILQERSGKRWLINSTYDHLFQIVTSNKVRQI